MKNPHDIILRPVLTEKSYDGMADKRYVFEVAINANKIEIKQAVEANFLAFLAGFGQPQLSDCKAAVLRNAHQQTLIARWYLD